VRFGVHVPQWGADATRDGVLSVARCAEDAGLDSVWVADHVVHPHESVSTYPYRPDGVPFGPEEGFLEAFTLLSVIAGATSRVQLGTSVLVMPMREPLLTAKTVATLDVLSGGRTILAMGAGWWEEEFDALGVPFRRRGKRFDEQLHIMRALWSRGELSHDGDAFSFGALTCRPLPVQPGGPPILIGGMGPAAWRRTARLGDGWHAVGANSEALERGRAEIHRLAVEAGRDPSAIAISTSTGLVPDAERLIARMRRLAGGGVTHAVFNVTDNTARGICSAIERFADEVLPTLRRDLPDHHPTIPEKTT
jgi:probable F420-dependent oxidoreductase